MLDVTQSKSPLVRFTTRTIIPVAIAHSSTARAHRFGIAGDDSSPLTYVRRRTFLACMSTRQRRERPTSRKSADFLMHRFCADAARAAHLPRPDRTLQLTVRRQRARRQTGGSRHEPDPLSAHERAMIRMRVCGTCSSTCLRSAPARSANFYRFAGRRPQASELAPVVKRGSPLRPINGDSRES